MPKLKLKIDLDIDFGGVDARIEAFGFGAELRLRRMTMAGQDVARLEKGSVVDLAPQDYTAFMAEQSETPDQ